MKIIYPPGHHRNGSVANHALGHVVYSYTLLAPRNQKSAQKAKQGVSAQKAKQGVLESRVLCVSC